MPKKYRQWIAISLTTMLTVILTIHLSFLSPAFAQNPATPTPNVNEDVKPNQSLRVVTRLIKPFVFEDGAELAGFSIDILRNVATELGFKYTLAVQPSVKGMLEQIKNNQADLGIAAVSITKERDKDFGRCIMKYEFKQER
jgi:polar amino acid transport system substrate-binding protein